MPQIIAIDENSPYLDQVIELGDTNSGTLGFFARGAFHDYAAKKHILIAIDEKEIFLGYLLYNITQRSRVVSIVHLSVEPSHQQKGVAKALVDHLKKLTKNFFRGIRIRCRRDYEVSNIWPKFGFNAIDEKPGRSKQGSTLTVWWFDHGHPTLFTLADKQKIDSKLPVVIDANIFYDLQSTPKSITEKESQSLLADWLNVELCLTSEIYNEIDRREDKTERKRGKNFAQTFTILPSSDEEFQKNCALLRCFFPQKMNHSDESDLRQLARTIAANVQFFVTRDNVQFFVTRDKVLLNKSEDIYENFGIRIISPSYLIIHQDELMRETEYQPVQLAGRIEIKRVHSGQISLLENTFYALQKHENKTEFKHKLQPCLAEPHIFETNIVQNRAGQPLALMVYKRNKPRELEIPIFRLVPNILSATLARYLILNMILNSSNEKRILTQITDYCLSDEVVDALQENGFMSIDNYWIKANLLVADTTKEFISMLIGLNTDWPHANQYFQHLVDMLNTIHNNLQRTLDVEQFLWPAKLTDIDMPTFMVPIWSDWAMQLFDFELAKQDLFGSEQSLIWNVENVYYCTIHKMLSAPARVLWYVSQGSGHYQGAMSIRACSYIDEIVIDKPKPLYSRFKRLGVYQWHDVFEVAGQNLDQKIMAFRFSHTEVFENPINREELQQIWKEETGKNFQIYSPISISNQLFFRLYYKGVQTISSE